MTATLDRGRFFARVRERPFGGRLTSDQVFGLDAILDACPPDLPSDHLAYCLATAYLETAHTMQPIKELGGADYFRRMYDPLGSRPAKAKELGNTQSGDGARYCGRGYVQLTGRNNYRRATTRLRAIGYLLPTQDMETTPELALHADLAAATMFVGMSEGWFTGKRLRDYFTATTADPVGARRIINGQDRAQDIADYFTLFRAALAEGGHKPGAVTIMAPAAPVETRPLPPPPAPKPQPTFWSRLGSWFGKPAA